MHASKITVNRYLGENIESGIDIRKKSFIQRGTLKVTDFSIDGRKNLAH